MSSSATQGEAGNEVGRNVGKTPFGGRARPCRFLCMAYLNSRTSKLLSVTSSDTPAAKASRSHRLQAPRCTSLARMGMGAL